MNQQHQAVIRRHSRPLSPRETGVQAVQVPLPDIKAVLFDIYGTLLISGSGDVGTSATSPRSDALIDALQALGAELPAEPEAVLQVLDDTIAADHQQSRRQGIDFPEIDIVKIWSDVILDCGRRGLLEQKDSLAPADLAVEFEVRANPVWPMPYMEECINVLSSRRLALGLISNAQNFTLELFPALVKKTTVQLGFAEDLQFFSFQHRQSKPGEYLYRLALRSLESRSIRPSEVLYIGNDMLNDIWPAHKVGFKTALFAADARSLRNREGDDRVAGLAANLVITDLRQIPDCLI